MDVSIIFVNYNTSQLTQNAIESVYKKTKNIEFEIIVVDNNSVDNSVSEIKAIFPKVVIIENKENIGFGRANNKGIKVAKGNYLFLLNTDTYLINNAVNILFDFMVKEASHDIGVCGAMLYKEDLTANVYAGNFPRFELFLKGSFWRYFYLNSNFDNKMRKQLPEIPSTLLEVDYVSGAGFFVKRNVIDEVGFFDPRFFMYSEDVELSYRINHIAKKKCVIVPDAKIVHISQGSSNLKSNGKKFQKQIINSRGVFYRITKGRLAEWIYIITSYKRLYF